MPANPANAAIITEKPEPKKIVAKRNKAALAKAAESLQHKGITSEGLASRTLGTKLYNVAGRPTKAQLILVYGPKGPAMTWPQRAEAGVSAEQFQDALKAKLAAETK